MMPYITAFFMPRTKGDRPKVVPDGCVNFAFLGQFADTPRDTVFTTEYSVRTAMEAVYGLLGVDRGVPEVWGQCLRYPRPARQLCQAHGWKIPSRHSASGTVKCTEETTDPCDKRNGN